VKVAASLLGADFSHLASEIRRLERVGCDLFHLDVMDGHFVSNITFGPMIVEAVDSLTELPLDVHLMMERPERYLEAFVGAGADYLALHSEVEAASPELFHQVRDMGVRPGVVLNPATPLSSIREVIAEVDYVVVMTVNPGFGGQEFIVDVVPKIAGLKQLIEEAGLRVEIEVDGGLNLNTAPLVVGAGASILVCGSAIFQAPDPARVIRDLKRLERWKVEGREPDA